MKTSTDSAHKSRCRKLNSFGQVDPHEVHKCRRFSTEETWRKFAANCLKHSSCFIDGAAEWYSVSLKYIFYFLAWWLVDDDWYTHGVALSRGTIFLLCFFNEFKHVNKIMWTLRCQVSAAYRIHCVCVCVCGSLDSEQWMDRVLTWRTYNTIHLLRTRFQNTFPVRTITQSPDTPVENKMHDCSAPHTGWNMKHRQSARKNCLPSRYTDAIRFPFQYRQRPALACKMKSLRLAHTRPNEWIMNRGGQETR